MVLMGGEEEEGEGGGGEEEGRRRGGGGEEEGRRRGGGGEEEGRNVGERDRGREGMKEYQWHPTHTLHVLQFNHLVQHSPTLARTRADVMIYSQPNPRCSKNS